MDPAIYVLAGIGLVTVIGLAAVGFFTVIAISMYLWNHGWDDDK